VLVWQPVVVEQFYPLAAQRVALASPLNLTLKRIRFGVLAPKNRLTSREDFARVTKSEIRSKTEHLNGYLIIDSKIDSPKIGFIVNRTIGGAVTRHRVSRQLRHASRNSLHLLPHHSLTVVKAAKKPNIVDDEVSQLFTSLNLKSGAKVNK